MSGPDLVFVVGMPRSGTKLLRELLNRHPDIAIFPNESHFVPRFCLSGAKLGDLTRPAAFARAHAELMRSPFFRRLAEHGIRLEREEWRRRLPGPEPRDAIEALFAWYAEATGSRIVGDKTPEYLMQIPLLSRCFPRARFVHILRDPRDYAASMRKAWGKSVPRAAQRWKTSIRRCRADALERPGVCLELRYEDLLSDPRATLDDVCRFLGTSFREEMLQLERPPENLGDTRGHAAIVADNFGKWPRMLSEADVHRIERIAGALMVELGYAPAHAAGDDDVPRWEMRLHAVRDAASLVRFGLEHGGLAGAFDELRPPARRRLTRS